MKYGSSIQNSDNGVPSETLDRTRTSERIATEHTTHYHIHFRKISNLLHGGDDSISSQNDDSRERFHEPALSEKAKILPVLRQDILRAWVRFKRYGQKQPRELVPRPSSRLTMNGTRFASSCRPLFSRETSPVSLVVAASRSEKE